MKFINSTNGKFDNFFIDNNVTFFPSLNCMKHKLIVVITNKTEQQTDVMCRKHSLIWEMTSTFKTLFYRIDKCFAYKWFSCLNYILIVINSSIKI